MKKILEFILYFLRLWFKNNRMHEIVVTKVISQQQQLQIEPQNQASRDFTFRKQNTRSMGL